MELMNEKLSKACSTHTKLKFVAFSSLDEVKSLSLSEHQAAD